jgi:hypothetical protein
MRSPPPRPPVRPPRPLHPIGPMPIIPAGWESARGLGPHGGETGMPDCHSVSSRPGWTRVAAGGLVLLAVLWPVLGGDPARAAAGSDRLLPGETLQAGQWISAGRDTLAMQGDGNLVLYAPGSTPIWATNTAGNDGAQLIMRRRMAGDRTSSAASTASGSGRAAGTSWPGTRRAPTGSRRPTRAARWPPQGPTGAPARGPRSAGVRTTSRAGTAALARPGPTGRPARTTRRC